MVLENMQLQRAQALHLVATVDTFKVVVLETMCKLEMPFIFEWSEKGKGAHQALSLLLAFNGI